MMRKKGIILVVAHYDGGCRGMHATPSLAAQLLRYPHTGEIGIAEVHSRIYLTSKNLDEACVTCTVSRSFRYRPAGGPS